MYTILSWQCFSFSSLTMSSYCLLTSSVSDEKSAINFIEVPSILHRQFFLLLLSRFFFCLHLAADCRCGFEFILLEICAALWMCTVFIRFGWFSAIMFSNIFVLLLLSPAKVKAAQSCPTFGDFMDYTVHGVLQARILEWVAFPFSRESSQPRDRTQVLLHCKRILYQLNHKGSPLGLPLYISPLGLPMVSEASFIFFS